MPKICQKEFMFATLLFEEYKELNKDNKLLDKIKEHVKEEKRN